MHGAQKQGRLHDLERQLAGLKCTVNHCNASTHNLAFRARGGNCRSSRDRAGAEKGRKSSRPARWTSALTWAVLILACAHVSISQAASGQSETSTEGQDVVEPGEQILTIHDFDQVVEEYNATGLLVEFFLPWCGHSRRLRPDFRRAAIATGGKPHFARVDCSSAAGLAICQQQEVQYHPTILLFMRGLSFEYQQRVTSSALIKYCQRMLSPFVHELSGLDETVATLQDQQVLVVAFHKEGEQFDDFYAEVAENLRDQMFFASISNQEYIDKLGIAQTPAYCIMRLGYPTLLWNDPVKEGESTALAFSKFVTGAHVLLVDVLTQENFYPKLGLGVPALILFADESAASQAALRSLYQPAMDFKGRINFCTVSGVRYQSMAVKLGVAPRLLPSVVIVDVGNQSQFVLPSAVPITDQSVAQFCADYWEGRLRPTLRSAVAPAHEEGPVFTLVADDFRRLVHDPQVDVLVAFRTTWCGFCNLLGPVLLSLASAASSVHSLKFFEFDVGENDPDPALNITSYPTVILFPAKNKTGVVYEGPRAVAELTTFLRHHVSVQLVAGPDGQLVSQEEASRLGWSPESSAASVESVPNVPGVI